MPKNRIIPFGYCMRNGEITVDFNESKAVARIFKEYLNGSSLQQIAKLMESEKVQYSEISDRWNKNMVKRIIENEKYLGNEKYPQIIGEKFFTQANEKRMLKATSVCVIPEDLQEIRNRTYCLECGHRLSRIGGSSRYEKWDCRNLNCYSTYSPTGDIIRKQNEINQMLDSSQVDFDRIKSELYRLTEMKYDCCTYNDDPQKTKQLMNLLENQKQLNTLDIGLFKSCVNRIWISHFCNIEVEFINGIKIKNITERNNKNDHSIKCQDNSCKITDGNKPQ